MNRRKFLKILAGAGAAAASYSMWPAMADCQGWAGSPRLIILYATCSVNKHYLSPYNPSVTYTPHLERFAARAAVFDSCQSECAQSGTAYAAILSGNQADVHGIFRQPARIDDSVFLITEAFAANGYDVYFWGGHPMADYKLNYGHGTKKENAFPYQLLADDPRLDPILRRLSDDKNYRVFILTTFSVTHFPYCPVYPPYPSFPFYNVSRQQYQKFYALGMIQPEFDRLGLSVTEIKFYYDLYVKHCPSLMCHFDKAASALGLSPEKTGKLIRTIEYVYQVNIARLDMLFGEVVEKIEQYGLFNDSLIVFTADHGETMYRDNAFLQFCHGFQLAPEQLCVPLMMSAPGAGIKPVVYDAVVRSVDIAPTITGLCGLRMGPTPAGIDLSQALTSDKSMPVLSAFSHTVLPLIPYTVLDYVENAVGYFLTRRRYSDNCETLKILYPEKIPEMMWVAVRQENLVYKIAKFDLQKPVFKPAVFNLEEDPEERRNLYDSENPRQAKILGDLMEYKQNLVAAYDRKMEGKRNSTDIDREEKLRRLRSLGYI